MFDKVSPPCQNLLGGFGADNVVFPETLERFRQSGSNSVRPVRVHGVRAATVLSLPLSVLTERQTGARSPRRRVG
jgi:hypothetical protein